MSAAIDANEEFRRDVRHAAERLRALGLDVVPLSVAAAMLPELREWREVADYVQRSLRGRRIRRGDSQ